MERLITMRLSKDELNNLLMTNLQRSLEMEIRKFHVNDDGSIEISGKEERDQSKLDYKSDKKFDLLSQLVPQQPKDNNESSMKNKGFSKFIIGLFEIADRITMEELYKESQLKYSIPKGQFRGYIKNMVSSQKKLVEVNEDVFMLAAKFDETHNKTLMQAS